MDQCMLHSVVNINLRCTIKQQDTAVPCLAFLLLVFLHCSCSSKVLTNYPVFYVVVSLLSLGLNVMLDLCVVNKLAQTAVPCVDVQPDVWWDSLSVCLIIPPTRLSVCLYTADYDVGAARLHSPVVRSLPHEQGLHSLPGTWRNFIPHIHERLSLVLVFLNKSHKRRSSVFCFFSWCILCFT